MLKLPEPHRTAAWNPRGTETPQSEWQGSVTLLCSCGERESTWLQVSLSDQFRQGRK
jgi:hypothetical protein